MRNGSPPGFTLVEITVALGLLALLSAIVAVSMRQTLSTTSDIQARDCVQQFDARLRALARGKQCRLEWVADLDNQEIFCARQGAKMATPAAVRFASCRLRAVQTRDGIIRAGRVVLDCSEQGWLPSYALMFDSKPAQFGLVFAGLTGAYQEVHDERDASQFFQQIAAGNDAH